MVPCTQVKVPAPHFSLCPSEKQQYDLILHSFPLDQLVFDQHLSHHSAGIRSPGRGWSHLLTRPQAVGKGRNGLEGKAGPRIPGPPALVLCN